MQTNTLSFSGCCSVVTRAKSLFTQPFSCAVMSSVSSFDASCSAQGAAQKRSGWGRKWFSLLGLAPLCLALLACQPSEVLAYKRGGSEPDQAAVQVRPQSQKRSQASFDKKHQTTDLVPLAALPALEQRVYRLIHEGGPFPYEKDGSIFANRERLLPAKKRGFYREYTVAPPRARSRGARRIVCGGPRQQPEVCYYTADHYASFQQIVP